MNRVISWLKNIGLRQIITVFLVALAFLVIPVFGYSQSSQAQAKPVSVEPDPYVVGSDTVERVQEKAEDLGDRSEKRGGRSVGETGLKNIRELGENIPETLGMRARTDAEDALNGDQKQALDDAQNQAGGVIESAKRAIQDVFD